MPLNKSGLQSELETRLKDNFQKGKDEAWTADQAAEELAKVLADAIDTFVRSGDVTSVASDVRDLAGTTLIGRGTQTGVGRVQ
jgi:alkanesulfonate monooxygenase SsuD/methylene tetrahydromethanopterin reductase-like flavin-dependent oxidoreductase (luciferase family)